MAVKEIQEPQGIAFYNVKSGETHYAKLEPTIAAYINSSDMGINASRGQDFGWKLGADWVKRVRDFRRDTLQMQILTSKNSGQKPSTVQILYYLYGEDLRAYEEEVVENENPYEDEYQAQIAEGKATPAKKASKPKAAPVAPVDDEEDDISDLIDDAIVEDEQVTTGVDPAKEGGDKSVKAPTPKQK
jgi:hypothetical protein